MSDYSKLFIRIWNDPDFIGLDEAPQRLFLLLFSFPTRNNAGILPLTIKRWAGCSRDGSVEKVTAALLVLIECRFILVDWDTEEVLIRTFLKNDETYRQPNVMKNALGEAVKMASPTLRRTLGQELKRLPNHKNQEQTLKIANLLVETPSEGFTSKPPTGGAEGCVVGGYVSTVGEAPAPAPRNRTGSTHRTPLPNVLAVDDRSFDLATSERDSTLSAPVGIGASRLVSTVIPQGAVNDADRTILRLQASELISTGETEEDVGECLRQWLGQKDLGPYGLKLCMAAVYKKRHNGHQLSTVDEKALGWQRAKNPERLEIE